jgi:hypothetical protein
VCAPSTAKPPPLCATTVPVVLLPSPQSIVAVKSLAVAFGLASVKVATGMVPVYEPSVPVMFTLVAVSEASATVALLVALVVLPPTSLMVVLSAYLPSSA